MKVKGSKFHPARISGKQKFLRNLEAKKIEEDKKNKHEFNKININNSDWSLR